MLERSCTDCRWANTQDRVKINDVELVSYACCYPLFRIPKPYFQATRSTTVPHTNCPTWAPKEESDNADL